MTVIFTQYAHLIGFASLVAALILELVLHKPEVDGNTARKLAMADALYGVSAAVVLITGLLNVFYFGKPAAYYGHNFIFHIKMTVFLLVFLVSIYPTIQFIKARQTQPDATVSYPRLVRPLLWVEMLLVAIIPLLGVMMARGYGVTG